MKIKVVETKFIGVIVHLIKFQTLSLFSAVYDSKMKK